MYKNKQRQIITTGSGSLKSIITEGSSSSLNVKKTPLLEQFMEAIDMEAYCYGILRNHGDSLNPQTHRSLVYLYGRIMTYLLALGSEEYISWIVENFEEITERLKKITPQIIKAEALSYYSSSLNLSLITDEKGNIVGGINELIEQKQKEKQIETTSDTINRTLNYGGAIITAASVATAATISWPLLIPLIGQIAYTTVWEALKSSQAKDANDLYQSIFLNIKNDFNGIRASIENEIEYVKLLRKQFEVFHSLQEETDISEEQYSLLVQSEYCEDEEELLGLIKISITDTTNDYLLSLDEEQIVKELNLDLSDINESAHQAVANIIYKVPQVKGLRLQKVPGDGHCLYHAVGLYLGKTQEVLREIVASYLENNIEKFRSYITLSSDRTIENYLNDIRVGREWTSEIEIEILMRVLNRPIAIIGPEGTLRNRDRVERFAGEPIFVYYDGRAHYDACLPDNPDILSARQILEKLKLTQFNECPQFNEDSEAGLKHGLNTSPLHARKKLLESGKYEAVQEDVPRYRI